MFSCWGLPSCSYSQAISPWQAFRYPIPIFPARVTIITFLPIVILNLFFRQSYLPPPQLQGVVVLCQDLRFWLKQSMIWPSLESLLKSRSPMLLQGNGFTASAVSYSMFALASLIAPSIVGWRGPRYLLLPAAAFIFFCNFQGLPCSARASCTFNTSHNFSIQSKVLLPLVLADPTNISQHLPSLRLLCHHWDRWTGSLECPGASPAFTLLFLSQSGTVQILILCQGNFLALCSDPNTIGRNSGIVWAMVQVFTSFTMVQVFILFTMVQVFTLF